MIVYGAHFSGSRDIVAPHGLQNGVRILWGKGYIDVEEIRDGTDVVFIVSREYVIEACEIRPQMAVLEYNVRVREPLLE